MVLQMSTVARSSAYVISKQTTTIVYIQHQVAASLFNTGKNFSTNLSRLTAFGSLNYSSILPKLWCPTHRLAKQQHYIAASDYVVLYRKHLTTWPYICLCSCHLLYLAMQLSPCYGWQVQFPDVCHPHLSEWLSQPHTTLEAPPQSSSSFVIPPPCYSLLHSMECCTFPLLVTMFPFVSGYYSLPIPVCYPLPLFLLQLAFYL